MSNDDDAVNRIFEMVKQKMYEKPKKKKRKRVFSPKQKEQMLKNLAKGRETLRKRREAKKKSNISLKIEAVKEEPKKLEEPTVPAKIKAKTEVKKERFNNPVEHKKDVPKTEPKREHKRVVPQIVAAVSDEAEESFINFSSGGSLW